MAVISTLKYFMLCSIIFSSNVYAGLYIALAPAQIKVITPAASSSPTVVDFRLGYAYQAHQLELVSMSRLQDDNVNQLITDVPSVQAIFYRYSSASQGNVISYFIIGASQVEITSTYPNAAKLNERYDGVSVGIGFEEAFQSIPQLKMKLDWMKLYSGKKLDINAVTLGLRYEF